MLKKYYDFESFIIHFILFIATASVFLVLFLLNLNIMTLPQLTKVAIALLIYICIYYAIGVILNENSRRGR